MKFPFLRRCAEKAWRHGARARRHCLPSCALAEGVRKTLRIDQNHLRNPLVLAIYMRPAAASAHTHSRRSISRRRQGRRASSPGRSARAGNRVGTKWCAPSGQLNWTRAPRNRDLESHHRGRASGDLGRCGCPAVHWGPRGQRRRHGAAGPLHEPSLRPADQRGRGRPRERAAPTARAGRRGLMGIHVRGAWPPREKRTEAPAGFLAAGGRGTATGVAARRIGSFVERKVGSRRATGSGFGDGFGGNGGWRTHASPLRVMDQSARDFLVGIYADGCVC